MKPTAQNQMVQTFPKFFWQIKWTGPGCHEFVPFQPVHQKCGGKQMFQQKILQLFIVPVHLST